MESEKSKSTFLFNKKIYHAYPTLDQFLIEAGIENATTKKKLDLIFDNNGIFDVSQLFSYAIRDLVLLGINKKQSILITKHLQVLRRRTNLILNTSQLQDYSQNYNYLSTANGLLDNLLTHANGKSGLRSKTLVEVYGKSGVGKTQLMKTFAVMCVRSLPGWSKKVYYIDTEGAFDIYRLYDIAELHGVDRSVIDQNLKVARAYNFDEVQQILTEIAINARHEEIGMIIIDSIIDPLKAQYPLDDDLSNLQERQQHLKIITDQLKSLAQIHNLICLITNQVRASFDKTDHPDGVVPQGGNVLSHATDLRFYLRDCHTPQLNDIYDHEKIIHANLDLKTIELIDCGFLPPGNADLIVGKMGTADPRYWKLFASDRKNMVENDLSTLTDELYS